MLGERIRGIRNSLGLTQPEFANRLDIKVLSVSQYERDKNLPGFSILKKICVNFNVNPRYLILGELPIFENEDKYKIVEHKKKDNEVMIVEITPDRFIFKIKEKENE